MSDNPSISVIIPVFTYDLAGIVSDKQSSEKISGADVKIFNTSGDTAEIWLTNENGAFESALAISKKTLLKS